VFSPPKLWLKTLRSMTRGLPHDLLTVACNAGLYSSKPIETWMEGALKDLVRHRHPEVAQRPVRFRDLTMPLHVVASDLAAAQPYVWSSEKTPNESVAFAVRCSCSIPLFYQAVRYGQAVLVDGGLLSNLPAFVFAALEDHERSALSRIVSFQLVGAPLKIANAVATPLRFVLRLSDTAIGGGTAIQLALQPDVYSVRIDTGEVSSTDFEGMTPEVATGLHSSGDKAVTEFLSRERAIVRQTPSRRLHQGFDEKLLLLVQGLQSCEHEMVAVSSSTYWVNFVFVALLAAARRGIQFVVYTQRSNESKENSQRALLRRLGAIIVELTELPFDGFVFDVATDGSFAVISGKSGRVGEDFHYAEEEISTYDASHDRAVINSLTNKLPAPAPNASASSIGQLPFTAVPQDQLFERLRRVSQYRHAEFELRAVKVTPALQVLQKSIKEYKIIQINTLIRAFRERGVALFHPQTVMFSDGTNSIVTPPVIERLGDRLVLIEGNTRAFHCLRQRVEEMTAVVVNEVEAPLPAEPLPLSDVRLTSATTPLANNLRNYDNKQFRKIEECIHEG
jgi:hypothetical protein